VQAVTKFNNPRQTLGHQCFGAHVFTVSPTRRRV